ncbi:MAG: hydroxymethylglutaryl-CoA lyase [Candidatus Aminicenantes bacterium]|nr:hydroxymethylglutaryl-CoA lyase [Candidatus Aminicenantes bacterium]
MADIIVHEVGPRDGLQVEKQVVPTEKKLAWIRSLAGAGLDIIQLGSFVNPEKVPQTADTEELFRALAAQPRSKTIFSGLALNERGVERGLACGVRMFCLGVSASETHSRKNTGMGSMDAQRRMIAVAKEAMTAGAEVQMSVQSAFGCGFEGPVPESRVLEIVEAYRAAGCRRISLADTAGHAYPGQVRRLFGEIRDLAADVQCACHFHDTYGLGMANIYAAFEAGAASFETSFAGLGGCPFTKVAAGNVATEDLVHAFQRSGLCRDIDLHGIIAVARDVAAHFGREMPGRVHKTGPVSCS